jgi:hypothetical protein
LKIWKENYLSVAKDHRGYSQAPHRVISYPLS